MSAEAAQPKASETFNCPRCAAPMVTGTASIRGDLASILLAGYSIQHLYFEFREGESKKTRIMLQSGASCPSHYCPKCYAFIIDNGKPEYS